MPYTLSMALLWVTLAVLLGIVMGWLMRSVVAKRQIERARSNHLDNVELERLRARVAELESADEASSPEPSQRPDVRLETLSVTVSDEPAVPAPASTPVVTSAGDREPVTASVDLQAASAAIGRDVTLDDLTAIEGIGPTVAELCAGIGITTWRDLAGTEVSLLRTMLHDAGPRFRTHDPATWPEQARLLAAGRWDEFRALTQELAGGRLVE